MQYGRRFFSFNYSLLMLRYNKATLFFFFPLESNNFVQQNSMQKHQNSNKLNPSVSAKG